MSANFQTAMVIAIALVAFRRFVIKAVIAVFAIAAVVILGAGAATLAGLWR